MMRSLYTAATGMQAEELKMDTVANNLANANTVGFKKVRADFEDLYSQTLRSAAQTDARSPAPPAPLQVGLGVQTGSTTTYQAQGTLTNTGNQTDLAIQGSGFFRIQQADGTFAYTRAGNFSLSANGHLVTANGLVVDPGIVVPAQTTLLTVTAGGVVQAQVAGSQTTQQLGTIQLATFNNPSGLLSVGNNLFTETPASGPAVMVQAGEQGSGTISQGNLESSNVSAVTEMIDMITAQRAYEMNSQVIQSADQMLQKLETIGQSE